MRIYWISLLISLFTLHVSGLSDAGIITDVGTLDSYANTDEPMELRNDVDDHVSNDKLGISDFDHINHVGDMDGIVVEEYIFESPDFSNYNNNGSEDKAEKETHDEITPPTAKDIEKVAPEVPLSANSVSSNNAEAEDKDVSQASIMPPITGCKTQGQVAMIYSEGPSDVTARIVRHLTKADAKANFFVNATWLNTQQYAMVLQNIYKAGHFIGMTYRIPNDSPSIMSDDEIKQDIIKNAQAIETVISVSPKYVRLHYTDIKDIRTESILQELGFVVVGYNLDSQDYQKKDITGPGSIQSVYQETFRRYKDTYDVKGSFIAIQYDLPYTGSLNAVPHVVNTIDEEGYTMVRLDGCLNDPQPYKKSAIVNEYISDKYSYNQADYHQGQKSVEIDITANSATDDSDELLAIEAELNIAVKQPVSWTAMSIMMILSFYIMALYI